MIFRVEKNRNYSVMSNTHLFDTNLSLKAIGLLSKVLALPDNWDYSIKGLESICKEGEVAIKSALLELKENGYLIVEKLYPNETESGRFEYVYVFYENPVNIEENSKEQDEEKQEVQNIPLENVDNSTQKQGVQNIPLVGEKQGVCFLPLENIPLNTNTNILNTNILNLSYHDNIKNKSPVLTKIEGYEKLIKHNIEYDLLLQELKNDSVLLDTILSIMVETVLKKKGYINLSGEKIPIKQVKKKIHSIRKEHVEYIINSLRSISTKVKNPRAYILAAILNAQQTMDVHKKLNENYCKKKNNNEFNDFEHHKYDFKALEKELLSR